LHHSKTYPSICN